MGPLSYIYRGGAESEMADQLRNKRNKSKAGA